jgi:hypothetical protein
MTVMSATALSSTPGVCPTLIPFALQALTLMWSEYQWLSLLAGTRQWTGKRREPTVTDRTRRNDLEVGVASVHKLLVDSITLVWVHDTCAVDFWVGEVLENPFAGRLSIFRVDNEIKAGRLEDGERVSANRAGAIDQLETQLLLYDSQKKRRHFV